ncbi:hypothetical protein ARALYDRAFT_892903 [Arabidopsis lyrata subsp. lyrata]|uniref:Uncharacterized protein n=1 Tax=Arabidopsis lyrata subsp. lyrata TaxID=81972 RepID=D7KC79_ARALL|nr:hypothetical protein ARALYDRAFT_892903 [Arabidopsis lyrata subsp. lyrata]
MRKFTSFINGNFFDVVTLSVSTNNSKCLDFFRTDPSQIAMIRSTYFYTISETQGLNRMDM